MSDDLTAGLDEGRLMVLRAVFVAAALESPDPTEALAWVEAREMGPTWLRALVRSKPEAAVALMSRTAAWVEPRRRACE